MKINFNILFLVFYFLFSDEVYGQVKSFVGLDHKQGEELAYSEQWLNLLHYKKSRYFFVNGEFESQADNYQFFLSPNGKYSPLDELLATLNLLDHTDKAYLVLPQSKEGVYLTPLCRFPARFKWLKEEIKNRFGQDLDISALSRCNEYKKFVSRMDAESATLVFSSYYLNNPSSTFGHTLIRLNRHKKGNINSSELLDNGINYAANSTTANPFLYAVLGLSGGFSGTFAVLPFYYKVREYNDYESRDLWEYSLNLDSKELERLVDHLWELIFTDFDYYYLTENCSYHMMTLLEAAAPRLKLSEKLPYWIIPGETIRILASEKNLIKAMNFRPSVRRQFFDRLDNSSEKEKENLQHFIENKNNLEEIPDKKEKSNSIDLAIDYLDYKYSKEFLNKTSPLMVDTKNKLLAMRSHLPSTQEPLISIPIVENPELSHPSGRGGVTLLSSSSLQLDWRFALHDFSDSIDGYPESSEINFLAMQWQTQDGKGDNTLLLNKIHIVGVASLPPLSKFDKHLSWRVQFGFEREPYLTELGTPPFLQAASGVTFNLLSTSRNRLFIYSLIQGRFSFQPHIHQGYPSNLFGIGPVLGLRWVQSERAMFNSEYYQEKLLSLGQNERFSWNISQSFTFGENRKWLVKGSYEKRFYNNEDIFSLGLFYYLY